MTTIRTSLFSLLLPLLVPLTAMAQLQDMDWLEWGYSAEVRGDYEGALKIWREGRNRLEQPDSRLGMAFIRLTTEQKLADWYEEATEMYLWAIAHPYTGNNRGVIRRELERLAPITGEAIYRQWLSWLEVSDPRLATDMRGFWVQIDPTPGEQLNERLIEHWLRIAEARREFTRNRLTHYQTDERGLIYVRYGEPDRRVSGVLTRDGRRTLRWFEQQVAAADPWRRIQYREPERAEPYPTIVAREHDLAARIESYVAPYHHAPEYEVWIYDAIDGDSIGQEGDGSMVEYAEGSGQIEGGDVVENGEGSGQETIGDVVQNGEGGGQKVFGEQAEDGEDPGHEATRKAELEGERPPTIFLFGTDIRNGGYRRVESIEEFIPLQAFQSDRHREQSDLELVRQGVSPALLLQMIYYEQLSAIHPWFRDQLRRIRTAFLEQGSTAYKAPDLSHRTRIGETLAAHIASAPQQISSEERLLPHIPLQVHQYRLLNEAQEPVIVTFLESRPAGALRQDLEVRSAVEHTDPSGEPVADQREDTRGVETANSRSTAYTLHHSLVDYNQEWRRRTHEVHRPQLDGSLYGAEPGESPKEVERADQGMSPDIHTGLEQGERVVQSVFITPHTGPSFQAGSAQLLISQPGVVGYSDLFPQELRGLGTVRNRQPEPLRSEPGMLELADLILGYRDALPDDYPFSFRVANDQTIAADESLILHFEVYNLEPLPTSGFTRFELTYRIFPVLEDGSLQTDDEAFYLTIRFEDDRTRLVEDLEIQTASLSSGLYELQVTIQDLVSQQQKSRSIRFEVTE